MKKRTTLLGLVIAGSVLFFSAVPVGAQNSTTSEQFNQIVEKIAQKLNLQPDQVKAVFEEMHNEKHSLMRANLESRLSQAVIDGTIAETQKQAILNKIKELSRNREENREEMMNKTLEERKQEMEFRKEELQKWAEENGLTIEVLRKLGVGFPHGHGFFKEFSGKGPKFLN